jgi:DNA polymerase-3 subunit alpha
MEKGTVLFLTGAFRKRFKNSYYDFKVNSIILLESLMKTSTRKLQIEMRPQTVSEEFIQFIEKNVSQYPGESVLRLYISDFSSGYRVGMYSTIEKGFTMNDELANYLQQKPEIDIKIELT